MVQHIKVIFYKAKEWIISHQKNLLLLVGILFVGGLAFESGFLRGKLSQSAEPMVISIPAVAEPQTGDLASQAGNPLTGVERIVSKTGEKQGTNCPLVGSRNSNKYHLVTCAVAKRIKPENKVCFTSKEDAERRGYVAGCLK
ncbi:MAG: hypothetical protein Q7S04_04115 [Candidatus Moranbacteria bacterium]|nr:hypothetical protein [Candidatus Moranbacteria bacterium]